ncbi:unnamed protein product [Durusdinium trenchii]
MFSGICCAERALESINAARKTFGADIGDLTEPLWTVECDAKARAAQVEMLPDTACKFLDVRDFIDAHTLAEMNKVTASGSGKKWKKWLTLVKAGKIPEEAFCSTHLKKCQIRSSFLDFTGSMCTSWSTLGAQEKEESTNSILLLIWMNYHCRKGTPLVGHENVDTFQSGMIVDEMFKAGYRHILVKVKPLDVGIPIGRPRRLLGNISILYTYIWIYIYM